MMTAKSSTTANRWIAPAFVATSVLLALTGFAQMPIFKRYYIADIPGLGWLAQYYTTHYLHYLGAILLMALAAYVATVFLFEGRRTARLTARGRLQAALLAGLIVTGVLRVVKNYEGYYLSEGWIVFLDILHFGLALAFLGVGIYGRLGRKPWTMPLRHSR